MPFDETDLDEMLQTTGEQVEVLLSGVVVLSPWGKFRENFERVSPYETAAGILSPVLHLKTSVAMLLTSAHVIRVRGVDYKFDGKPEKLPSGLTAVHLGVKK